MGPKFGSGFGLKSKVPIPGALYGQRYSLFALFDGELKAVTSGFATEVGILTNNSALNLLLSWDPKYRKSQV